MTPPKPHIPLTDSEVQRFWKHVEKSDSCWRWTLALGSKGYGQFGVVRDGKVKQILAHRVAYELTYGPIPDGLLGCHSCDHPWCVNPDHIFPGTHQDNMDDRNTKKRQAQGDRTRSRLYPETLLRGDAHPARLRPEIVARGERNGNSRLTAENIIAIRQQYTGKRGEAAIIGAQYGTSDTNILRIVKREIWRHVP